MVWTDSSSTAVELRWWAPETDNGSGTVEGYRVEASGDGGTSWTRIADLGRAYTFTERGLDGAVAGRQYRVAAWNAAGQGPWSGTATPAAARFTGNYKTEVAHESARVRIRVRNPDGSKIHGRWHVEGETPGSGGTFDLDALDAWSAVRLTGLEPETDYEVEFNLTSDFSATDGDRRRKVSFSTLQRHVLAVSPPWVDVIGAPEKIERGGSASFEIALGVACRGTWNVSVEAPGGALSLTPSGVIALGCGEPNPATEITVTAAGHAAAETAVIRVSGKGSEQARPGADRLIRVKLRGAVQSPPGGNMQTAVQGLTATFEDVPSEHGGNPFTVTLAFSEHVDGVSYRTLHEAFSATGGRITRVSRTDPGGAERNRRWTLEVTPENGDDDVTLTLPANAPGLPDGRMLAAAPATLVSAEQREVLEQTADVGLTATFEDVPGTHNGNPFTLTLRFSEHIAELTGAALQAAFTVTGGSVTGVERTDPGATENNLGWTVTVTPKGDAAVALLLAADALGLSDGRELAAAPAALVQHGQPAEERQETVGLTASFETPPSEHGGDPFTLTLGFSENLDGVGYRTLHEAFSVTGGEITRVSRTDPGAAERNLRWTLEVRPFGIATVTITLPANAPGLPDGRTLAADASVTVPAEQEQPQPVQPPPPLTASFSGVPSEHDGNPFSFTLGFSEHVAGLTAATLRGALGVTGGAATGVTQADPGRYRAEPALDGDGDAGGQRRGRGDAGGRCARPAGRAHPGGRAGRHGGRSAAARPGGGVLPVERVPVGPAQGAVGPPAGGGGVRPPGRGHRREHPVGVGVGRAAGLGVAVDPRGGAGERLDVLPDALGPRRPDILAGGERGLQRRRHLHARRRRAGAGAGDAHHPGPAGAERRRRAGGGGGRGEAGVPGDALAGHRVHGDGAIRDLGRHGDRARGLYGDQRHAHLRAPADFRDGVGAGARRQSRRGPRDADADAVEPDQRAESGTARRRARSRTRISCRRRGLCASGRTVAGQVLDAVESRMEAGAHAGDGGEPRGAEHRPRCQGERARRRRGAGPARDAGGVAGRRDGRDCVHVALGERARAPDGLLVRADRGLTGFRLRGALGPGPR